MFSKLVRNRKGQGLVEYGLLIAGVALVGIVGVSILGHKSADLIGTTASIMPGAHTDDNGPVYSGHLVQTTDNNAAGAIVLDTNAITTSVNTSTLDANMGLTNDGGTLTDQSFVTDNILPAP